MNNYNNQGYMQTNYPGLMDIDPMRYPDIYYMIYPFVVKKCDMMEKAYSPTMYPYPSAEMIEKMTDEIYNECKECYPQAIREYEDENNSSNNNSRVDVRRGRGRRSLLRGLIGTLLIRELTRRRGYPGYYYPYGRGYYGGYPYGGYYGDYIY